jgi:hypothetical protein
VPEVGGPIDPNNEARDLIMSVRWVRAMPLLGMPVHLSGIKWRAPRGQPDQGLRGGVAVHMQDQQGRLHRIRFSIAQKWRAEATALTAAARGSQPGYGSLEPG